MPQGDLPTLPLSFSMDCVLSYRVGGSPDVVRVRNSAHS